MRARILAFLLVAAVTAAGCRPAGPPPAAARPASEAVHAGATSVAGGSGDAALAAAVSADPALALAVGPPAPEQAPAAPLALAAGEAPRDAPRIAALPRVAGERVVVLDPGHAEDEVGAAAHGVVEKTSNLDMALRVEALLQQRGVRVVLTRRADARAYTGSAVQGYSATRRDLQARVDLANEAGGDVFVSLHSNGAGSADTRGVETYWNSERPFSDLNRRLADTIQASVVREMAAAGTPTVDRGAKDDSCLRAFQGRCFPLFVLGPPRTTSRDEVLRRGGTPEALGFAPEQDAITSRATAMPGALVELLFVSSPADAAWLRTEAVRDTLARGVAFGILAYLEHPREG